jgi:hypothetical protein
MDVVDVARMAHVVSGDGVGFFFFFSIFLSILFFWGHDAIKVFVQSFDCRGHGLSRC